MKFELHNMTYSTDRQFYRYTLTLVGQIIFIYVYACNVNAQPK
jgi:hypothetical protein